ELGDHVEQCLAQAIVVEKLMTDIILLQSHRNDHADKLSRAIDELYLLWAKVPPEYREDVYEIIRKHNLFIEKVIIAFRDLYRATENRRLSGLLLDVLKDNK